MRLFRINLIMEKKQVYESPQMKAFTVHLQGRCCEAVSNTSGNSITRYSGDRLGKDSF